ncbi:hypothetical protein [Novosphingobium sp. 9U]|uniref:hypothetical protein n=1 Tax=Novosphingobium sp. 9U TaxID=2653158 RepID=UPI0012EF7558|nr:hypothetical protein [Novosphingobium sp. 9U]VWX52971.1 conserved hypothetical protein [Novosphingobium sp. 9U]
MVLDMTARTLINSPATRADLDHAMVNAAPHLRPIVKAVRDHGVDMLFAGQGAGAFRVPAGTTRPVIFMVGDDFDKALGPEGFHMPSIRRAIRSSHSFAIISSGPQADAYTAMALAAAATRQNTVIVETRPEQEIAWLALVQKLAPGRFIWLATVEGGHA